LVGSGSCEIFGGEEDRLALFPLSRWASRISLRFAAFFSSGASLCAVREKLKGGTGLGLAREFVDRDKWLQTAVVCLRALLPVSRFFPQNTSERRTSSGPS